MSTMSALHTRLFAIPNAQEVVYRIRYLLALELIDLHEPLYVANQLPELLQFCV
jgi:hypothetical protein